MKLLRLFILSVMISAIMTAGAALAQPPATTESPVKKETESRYSKSEKPVSWRVRAARFRQQQHELRMEYYAWIGFNPARPVVNPTQQIAAPVPLYYYVNHPSWYGF